MLISFSGCEKYTDITPKGQNLLNKASDIDLLLNAQYSGNAFNNMKQSTLINDMYGQVVNVPVTIAGPINMNKVLLTYDEKSDRAALTVADDNYDGMYEIISKVANITIVNSETASGDKALLNLYKAEAYIIRAYMHYMLVNNYAKAYDPATAETDGGIPYVNSINFEELNRKNTIKEVYDNINADIASAFALNTLPDKPKNIMRVGKGFAYAVKAMVLMSMRNYAGALEAANLSLTYNSTLEDHRPILSLPLASRIVTRNGVTSPDNIFYAYQSKPWPALFGVSIEILTKFYETGNIFKDYTPVYNFPSGILYNGVDGSAIWSNLAYEQNAAGITTSDMIMVKAEALIRTGKVADGMAEIEKIRVRRINPTVYAPLMANTEAEGMAYLQKVSRIEFLFTWKNFINVKRWNREGKYPVVVERTVNNIKYTLSPNSPLWVFPFPQSATMFNTTLTQNY
ncbi:SusD family protein [compost metagenome]